MIHRSTGIFFSGLEKLSHCPCRCPSKTNKQSTASNFCIIFWAKIFKEAQHGLGFQINPVPYQACALLKA